jgi:spermidine/putrescine transport system substrate-binding protein
MKKHHFLSFKALKASLLMFALAGLLNSCSDQIARTAEDSSNPRQNVVRVITWEDYVAPEVIESFEKKTGMQVDLRTFENTEDLIGKLRAGSDEYDVVIFDSSSVNRLADIKLLRPLKRASLSGFSNIDEKFLAQASDPDNEFSVPYLWGSTIVAYRSDKIDDPEPSFELLFDESLRGRVMMLDDMFESFGMAHLVVGQSINTTSEEGLHKASEKLREQVRKVGARYGSDAEIREALASGECWAALCYSGDAAWVAEDNPEVSYFFPKEGASLWLDVMTISKDSANLDGAHAFIDYMLRPEVIAETSNSLWYANPNKHATKLLSEELLEDEALVPPKEVAERCEFFTIISNEDQAAISRLSSAIRAEAQRSTAKVSLQPVGE